MRTLCTWIIASIAWFAGTAPSSAFATDIYVATGGHGDGSATAPIGSIGEALPLAKPGDTIWIAPGEYRGTVQIVGGGTVGRPLTLRGWGGRPMLKGSRLVDGFQEVAPNLWCRTHWTVPSQDVIVDGRPLTQVGYGGPFYDRLAPDGNWMRASNSGGPGSLEPGSFCYVPAEQAIYVRMPSNGSPPVRVEASVDRCVLDLELATDVIVRDLDIRHSSSGSYLVGGGAVELGTRCRLESCTVSDCDFCGVHCSDGHEGAEVVDCTVTGNGSVGISADSHAGFLIKRCTVSDNNRRGFNPFWHAGGIKATSGSSGTITSCLVSGNIGPGVWFDFADSGAPSVIERCELRGNLGDAGIGAMIEGSRLVRVTANVIDANDSRGIYISASEDVDCAFNTVTQTRHDAAIDLSGTPRAGKRLRNVRISNNIVSANLGRADLFEVFENGQDVSFLTIDHNLFYRPGGALVWWGSDGRSGWSGRVYTGLAGWMDAGGPCSACVEADPRLVNATPAADSPAIGSGIPIATVSADFRGDAMRTPPTMGALQSSRALSASDHAGSTLSGTTMPSEAGPPIASVPGRGCGIGSAAGMLALALLAFRVRRLI